MYSRAGAQSRSTMDRPSRSRPAVEDADSAQHLRDILNTRPTLAESRLIGSTISRPSLTMEPNQRSQKLSLNPSSDIIQLIEPGPTTLPSHHVWTIYIPTEELGTHVCRCIEDRLPPTTTPTAPSVLVQGAHPGRTCSSVCLDADCSWTQELGHRMYPFHSHVGPS
jgi:hypothetical protein